MELETRLFFKLPLTNGTSIMNCINTTQPPGLTRTVPRLGLEGTCGKSIVSTISKLPGINSSERHMYRWLRAQSRLALTLRLPRGNGFPISHKRNGLKTANFRWKNSVDILPRKRIRLVVLSDQIANKFH